MFFIASEKVMVNDLRNNPGSGSSLFISLSVILMICFSYANWILSSRFIFHSPGMGVAM